MAVIKSGPVSSSHFGESLASVWARPAMDAAMSNTRAGYLIFKTISPHNSWKTII
jgi:hypothetical protein